MKMKEKKTEEVVEEVIETPKISNELREYLEFARYCKIQLSEFYNELSGAIYVRDISCDLELERFGVKCLPVNIKTGFSKDNCQKYFEEFVEEWIIEYNKLDFSKYDNYTNLILKRFAPDVNAISMIRRKFKKCEQHITEE